MKITFNINKRFAGVAVLAAAIGTALAACGGGDDDAGSPGGNLPDASPVKLDATTGDGGVTAPADSGVTDAGTVVETTVRVDLTLAAVVTDAGASDAGEAADASDAGGSAATAATLTIQVHDGQNPVITDLWLYTLTDGATPVPLTAFTTSVARKSPRLMLPATIGGVDSGLAPANDGASNGVLTNFTRGVLQDGGFVPTFDGKVVVTLPSAPTAPILVVAGVEDQRYAGAQVVQPDGSIGTVPAGIGAPQTHVARTFSRDVAPILQQQCLQCHFATGPDNAGFYLVTGSRDDLVNANFALNEQTADCQTANPDGGASLAACIAAITTAQFLVEPGVPAATDLLQRARPDEDAGVSPEGLLWYGSKGNRYNTTYGDRRMPSTNDTTDPTTWLDPPTYFDEHPAEYQVIYDWVAQGAQP